MKKRANIFTGIGAVMLLGTTLLLHFHILGARKALLLAPAALILYVTGVVIKQRARKKTVEKTAIVKVFYGIIYSALFIFIVALALLICHVRVAGRELMVLAMIVLLIGFVVLMIGVMIPVTRIKSIISPRFYWQSLLINLSLFLFSICIITGMLLRVTHHPGPKIFFLISQVCFVVFMMLIIYYLVVTKKKYQAANAQSAVVFPVELDNYAGPYRNQELNISINIIKKEEAPGLLLQFAGMAGFPLTVLEKDKFTFARAGIIITFRPEENELMLIQNGRNFNFIKE